MQPETASTSIGNRKTSENQTLRTRSDFDLIPDGFLVSAGSQETVKNNRCERHTWNTCRIHTTQSYIETCRNNENIDNLRDSNELRGFAVLFRRS